MLGWIARFARHHRPIIGLVAACTVMMANGCDRGTPAIALTTVDEARAFQAEQDAEFRDEVVSPLTASFSRYVADGERLSLGFADGSLTVDDAEHAEFVFAQGAGTLTCESGCQTSPLVIDSLRSFDLGSLKLLASPQSGPGRVVVHDPNAPARRDYRGRHWGPVDAEVIIPAKFEAEPASEPMPLTTSRGLKKKLPVAGTFSFELGGKAHTLIGFVSAEEGDTVHVLIPFFDASNGDTSYPTGRYLNIDLRRDQSAVVLDFNRATNPYCAYSEHYNCPVPPASNRISAAISAGELTYAEH